MEHTIRSYRPCCWEDDDDCLAPALPDSLWCAKHTAWAARGYDPGMDALIARRGLPPVPPSLPSPTPTGRPTGPGMPTLPSPGSGEQNPYPRVRGRSHDPGTTRELPGDEPGITPELARHDPETTQERGRERDPVPESVKPDLDSFNESDADSSEGLTGRRCAAITRSGTRCRVFPRRHDPDDEQPNEFCVYHDPAYRRTLRATARRAGRASAESRFPPPDPLDEIMSLPLDLSTRGSVQAAIDGILRMHLSGQITPRRSGPILQLLNMAMRNVTADAAPGTFATNYNSAAPPFRHTTKRAIQHIANEDLRQRVNEISDVKSKRQAFLQANDEFGYPYRVEKR